MDDRNDHTNEMHDGTEPGGHDLLTAGLMVVLFAGIAFAPEALPETIRAGLETLLAQLRDLPREAVMVGVPLAVFAGVAIEKLARALRRVSASRGGRA